MLSFHPYADLFPLIEGEEFAELVADIKANDLREKIVIWEDSILDGRNRYRAAIAARLLDDDDQPDRTKYFQKFVREVDGDPLKFVISKNLKRRHLNDIQRASVAAKIANLSHGGDRSNPPIGGLSVEKSAQVLKVAPRQVERARVVHEYGGAEVRQALDRGEIAVSVAEKIARLPQSEQGRQVARALPNGARSIMGSRQEPLDGLDFFPTPPWATRALVELVLGAELHSIWEPACGAGHMAEVLREYCDKVIASDIFDYGYGKAPVDFTKFDGAGADWIITNPPFGDLTEQFVLKALDLASIGVAMFVRLQWLESVGRYETIFRDHPPTCIAFFAERVPLCKGEWKPDGATATAYIWLVWIKGQKPRPPFWIPPGQRERLTYPDDAIRFTAKPVIRKEDYKPPESGTNHQPNGTDGRQASTSVSEPASADSSAPQPTVDAGSPLLPEILLPGMAPTFAEYAAFTDLTSPIVGRAS